jgi:hypothetical protein
MECQVRFVSDLLNSDHEQYFKPSCQVRFVSNLFDDIASDSSYVSFKLCHIFQKFNKKTCKLLDDEN